MTPGERGRSPSASGPIRGWLLASCVLLSSCRTSDPAPSDLVAGGPAQGDVVGDTAHDTGAATASDGGNDAAPAPVVRVRRTPMAPSVTRSACAGGSLFYASETTDAALDPPEYRLSVVQLVDGARVDLGDVLSALESRICTPFLHSPATGYLTVFHDCQEPLYYGPPNISDASVYTVSDGRVRGTPVATFERLGTHGSVFEGWIPTHFADSFCAEANQRPVCSGGTLGEIASWPAEADNLGFLHNVGRYLVWYTWEPGNTAWVLHLDGHMVRSDMPVSPREDVLYPSSMLVSGDDSIAVVGNEGPWLDHRLARLDPHTGAAVVLGPEPNSIRSQMYNPPGSANIVYGNGAGLFAASAADGSVVQIAPGQSLWVEPAGNFAVVTPVLGDRVASSKTGFARAVSVTEPGTVIQLSGACLDTPRAILTDGFVVAPCLPGGGYELAYVSKTGSKTVLRAHIHEALRIKAVASTMAVATWKEQAGGATRSAWGVVIEGEETRLVLVQSDAPETPDRFWACSDACFVAGNLQPEVLDRELTYQSELVCLVP